MSPTTAITDPIVQLVTRMPKSLKDRLEDLKYTRSAKTKTRVTNDEIVIAALDMYLKKFRK
jgi:hypothetical protein